MTRDSQFVRPLLAWYRKSGRDLPWRRTKDPYKIWLSEVMLQQTQVSRVIDYYERFLRRFPTLASLAKSDWRSVLPLWRGLGYYSRGKNILAAARMAHPRHRGRLPQSYAELRALPGIGDYTANAILSFAHGAALPALDTNIKRVLSRVLGIAPAALPGRAAQLFETIGKQAPDANHALMDLGALICRSKRVACQRCPLNRHCKFFLSGKAERLNTSKAKQLNVARPRGAIDVGAACIHRDGSYLLAKRSARKGGEWEFPGGKREPGESIRDCLKREIQEELGIEVAVRPPFFIREASTGEKRYRLHFCRCQILRGKPEAREHAKLAWVAAALLSQTDFAESNRAAAAILSRKQPPKKKSNRRIRKL